MTIQDIKRGHWKVVEGDGLKDLMEEHFDSAVEVGSDGWHTLEYGALRPLRAKMLSKSELEILTEANPDVTPEVASDTIRRYNRFLEAVTGFNSKERKKRLNQKAKDGKL
jgi:hypothetical protein